MPRANPKIVTPELPHKWAGSKRRIARQLFTKLPWGCRRFVVPFYGGGADALTAVASDWCQEYLLADVNQELVNAHVTMGRYPALVSGRLSTFASLSEDEQRKLFLDYRCDSLPLPLGEASEFERNIDRAVRFFVLVMCGYNGLWRENRAGKYNVPWGQKFRLNEAGITQAAECLCRLGVRLLCQDYRETLAQAGEGDLVYCDPPYLPRKETGGFTYVRGDDFSGPKRVEAHEELVSAMRAAARRGARCFATGSNTDETERIYTGGGEWRKWYLRSKHSISCEGSGRGKVVGELLFEVLP